MKKIIKRVIILAFLCAIGIGFGKSFPSLAVANKESIMPYAYREPLPIQYEVWYSYHLGSEYKNYVYREYTFLNGFNRTNHYQGRIDLTPLELEFYSKAELWTVSYTFY